MLSHIIATATADKKLAQAARKDGNYVRAIELIERAIERLEAESPRLDRVVKGVLSEENRALAEALADLLGSSGGIYRSAHQYDKSITAYDAGCRIEQDERFGFVNSYNLTQRLVARILFEPHRWVVDGAVIKDETFPACLDQAFGIVNSQTSGTRARDPWAWADLGMLSVLRGDAATADRAWDKLIGHSKQPYPFTSTISVFDDLLARIEPVAEAPGAQASLVSSRDALVDAARFLRDETPVA